MSVCGLSCVMLSSALFDFLTFYARTAIIHIHWNLSIKKTF